MARTCALILLVQPALHRVSCSNETIQNAPKHYKMNMSIGSNGLDRMRSLRTIPMRLHGTNLWINSTISAHFASSLRAVPKQSKMLPNTTKHTKTWAYGPMGWIGCVRYQKFWCDFVGRTFALIAPVQPVLHRVSCSNETIQKAPKHSKHINTCI